MIDALAELRQPAVREVIDSPYVQAITVAVDQYAEKRSALGLLSQQALRSADPAEPATCLRHRCLLPSLLILAGIAAIAPRNATPDQDDHANDADDPPASFQLNEGGSSICIRVEVKRV